MNVQYHRLTDAGFAYAVRMPERNSPIQYTIKPMPYAIVCAVKLREICAILPDSLTETREEDCVLIEPRCPEGSFWVAMLPELKRFVCRMIEAYACDPERVTLTGLSMGGYGTWFLAMAAPELFAAIAPCCGGGMPWNAEVLTMPVWAFHGALDDVVPLTETVDMVKAIQRAGGNARLTVFGDCGHDAWTYAYDEMLLQWLLAQKRTETDK